ncbi:MULTISPECIES: TetR/AcrR family transcriptional regulator [Paenibacillus]|uniref:TetR/AcrR family transcriptional regulator n=1 Tax=Paenibacillus TaxID=44249 RepID=UPI0022B89D09|nr:TetR/AcrR family transcriptional regulator [Paenibacillus caseinilyticus]MCZ8522494.1 TetR/AcrR family transcriptional regulator [Paenibacillus caseinilyticus]
MGRNKEFDTTQTLYKAMKVFGQYGYEGTSLQQLLDQLGIARQSLYDTYGTKQGLFVSALRRYIDEKNSEVVRLLDESPSVREALSVLFEQTVDVLQEPERFKECYIVNSAVEQAPHDPEIARIVDASTSLLEEAHYRALLRAREQGELPMDAYPDDKLRSLARYLHHTRMALVFTARSGAGTATLRDIAKITLCVLDSGR